jgi:hypothetical protein
MYDEVRILSSFWPLVKCVSNAGVSTFRTDIHFYWSVKIGAVKSSRTLIQFLRWCWANVFVSLYQNFSHQLFLGHSTGQYSRPLGTPVCLIPGLSNKTNLSQEWDKVSLFHSRWNYSVKRVLFSFLVSRIRLRDKNTGKILVKHPNTWTGFIHACMHTYIRTYVHTYIHTYAYILRDGFW